MPNDGLAWESSASSIWNRDHKWDHGPASDNYKKYLPYRIRGLMFSGVPQTTLCNTFRKLCYSFYDIFVATGRLAWRDNQNYVIAAGDDGATFGTLQNL
jgi:hypothetical protein